MARRSALKVIEIQAQASIAIKSHTIVIIKVTNNEVPMLIDSLLNVYQL